MDQNNGLFRGNHGEALRFFTRALKNNFLSEKNGRPIFDTGLFVEIITPGSTASVPEKLIERTISEGPNKGTHQTADYARFKAQVDAYKANTGEYAQDGMPITEWPQVDTGTAHTLRAQGIHTVEQLAQVADGNLQNLGTGAMHLRDKAKAYITARQFGIPVAQQTAENNELRAELARVTNERDTLLAQLAEARNATTAETKRTKAAKAEPPPPPEPAESGTGVI